MTKKTYNQHLPLDQASIDEAVNQALGAMLLAEADLTGTLSVMPDDSERSALIGKILGLRGDIDLLVAKYRRFVNGKVALAPPSAELIATAAGLADDLAQAQASQNRIAAVLALSAKALDAAKTVLNA